MTGIRLIVCEQADEQIKAAARWYDRRRRGLGKEFVKSVRACLDQIKLYPRINPAIHRDIRRALTQRFPYKIYYILEDEGRASVLAVRHQSRDEQAFLDALLEIE